MTKKAVVGVNQDVVATLKVVLKVAENLAVRRRIQIYRGVADLCGDPEEQRELRKLASDLEASERLCREFRFRFIQKTSATPSK